MSNCGRCGGSLLASGALHSPVRMAFRPQDSKFLTLQSGDVMTKATMCRDCGNVEITGDVVKLKHLLGEAEPAPVKGGVAPKRVE
jgi:ribosomal protein S27AE